MKQRRFRYTVYIIIKDIEQIFYCSHEPMKNIWSLDKKSQCNLNFNFRHKINYENEKKQTKNKTEQEQKQRKKNKTKKKNKK